MPGRHTPGIAAFRRLLTEETVVDLFRLCLKKIKILKAKPNKQQKREDMFILTEILNHTVIRFYFLNLIIIILCVWVSHVHVYLCITYALVLMEAQKISFVVVVVLVFCLL